MISLEKTMDTITTLFEMSHMSSLYIHGKDAESFLQGQLTCHIELLEKFHAQPTACCNLQGRVIALFFVMHWQDGYLLILPKSIQETTLKHFKKYAIFSKITFETPDLAFIGVNNAVPSSNEGQQPVLYTCLGHSVAIFSGESAENDLAAYTNSFSHPKYLPWHYLQMTQGFPNIYPETQGLFLPHRIGLQNLVGVLNFNKGCYLGQEIIARTHFKAVLKHAIYLCEVSSETTVKPGDSIDDMLEIIDVAPTSAGYHFLASIKIASISSLPSHIKILNILENPH